MAPSPKLEGVEQMGIRDTNGHVLVGYLDRERCDRASSLNWRIERMSTPPFIRPNPERTTSRVLRAVEVPIVMEDNYRPSYKKVCIPIREGLI